MVSYWEGCPEIDRNSTILIVPGVFYDIVFVGTFQDGNTSISWANPIELKSVAQLASVASLRFNS